MKALLMYLSVAHGFIVVPSKGSVVNSVEVAGIGSAFRRVRGLVRDRGSLRRKETLEVIAVVEELEDEAAHVSTPTSFFDQVDSLHKEKQYDSLLVRLESGVGSDELDQSEVMWRIARCNCDLSEGEGLSKKKRESFARNGLAAAEKGVELNPANGFCQKWLGIMLGMVGDYEPIKKKISNSYRIKDALDAAHVALPNDPTVKLALGQWCYKISSIDGLVSNVASVVFGTPPTSSYQDALRYFEESHYLKPTDKAEQFIKKARAKISAAA